MSYVPVIYTPFSDFAWLLNAGPLVLNPDSLCSKIHLRFIDCMEAYGHEKGRDKCAELFYDMCECRSGTFQILRSKHIRSERMKQYREGKLKQPFDENPPLDSYIYL